MTARSGPRRAPPPLVPPEEEGGTERHQRARAADGIPAVCGLLLALVRDRPEDYETKAQHSLSSVATRTVAPTAPGGVADSARMLPSLVEMMAS